MIIGAWELFTTNYNSILTEKEHKVTFDTYVFTKEKLKKIKEINDEKNYGDDVTEYLGEILKSDADIIYMQIF